MPAPDDPASATLAGIRKDIRAAFIGYGLDQSRPEALKLAYPPAVMAVHASRLLAAIEALTAALERHQQWFINDAGVKICGGCLEPFPCKDDPERIVAAALTGKDAGDGD